MGARFGNWLCTGAAVLALVGPACGPSQEELDAANARADELQAELNSSTQAREELEERLGTLQGQNDAMTERLRALGHNVGDLEAQRADLQRALRELQQRQQQAEARLNTFRQLMERFRSMISSGRLRVRIVRNRMVLVLSENILFDSGKVDLKREAQEPLQEVAGVLADIPDREFQVVGHTDNVPVRGRYRSNWSLSSARAVTVTQFLIENGVPENRISAAGMADTQPVASNETPEGRAQNRRIEIVLLPNLNELPDLSQLNEVADEEAPAVSDEESSDGEGDE